MPRDPLTNTLASEAQVDAWLGWVERTYGLASCSVDRQAAGFVVTARLPESPA